jgi:hypothetical protein
VRRSCGCLIERDWDGGNATGAADWQLRVAKARQLGASGVAYVAERGLSAALRVAVVAQRRLYVRPLWRWASTARLYVGALVAVGGDGAALCGALVAVGGDGAALCGRPLGRRRRCFDVVGRDWPRARLVEQQLADLLGAAGGEMVTFGGGDD